MTVIPAQEVEAGVPQCRVILPGVHETSSLVNKQNKKFPLPGSGCDSAFFCSFTSLTRSVCLACFDVTAL